MYYNCWLGGQYAREYTDIGIIYYRNGSYFTTVKISETTIS